MNLGRRIESRLEELGWKRTDLLRKVPQLTPQSISALITRDSKRSDFAIEIARALGVTVEWLTNGTSPKLAPGNNGHDEPSIVNIPLDQMLGTQRAACILPVHEGMSINKQWVDIVFPDMGHGSDLCIVPVNGYGMAPTFGAGDLLLVDRSINDLQDEGVYVVRMADRASIKRLQGRPDGSIVVMNDNPQYDPIIIAPEKAKMLEILGRAIYCWTGKRL